MKKRALHETEPEIFNWINPGTVIVKYLRRLFSDKEIRLVYSNEPNKIILPCPVNDGSNRTTYKTCLKFWIETQKMQASQGRCRSKYCRKAIAKV